MIEHYLEVAIKAAKTSGSILTDYFEKLHNFKQKNQNIRDLVTEVDILSEKNIKEKIREVFPEHSIIGEESGLETKETTKIWYVDPLDGTVNYCQGIPLCAISIALQINNEIVIGVIYNPLTEELYFASKGHGAYLNGKKIHVSRKENVKDGLYVAAFSAISSKEKIREYEIFGCINDATRGALRIGSAALALAYLACGRIDGFWVKHLYSWDLAAGIILINEAGGNVTYSKKEGSESDIKDMVASNGLIHSQLLELLNS